MDASIVHEPGRFVLRMEGAEAHLRYERHPGVLEVLSTWTPPELRGGGVAARLTEAAVALARREGLRIRPTCSYTRTYLQQHAELRDLAEDE
jgi:predicted GNAT family acetyltransferase